MESLPPCECTEDITCGYCIQANLTLWEREQKQGASVSIIEKMKAVGIRRLASLLGADPGNLSRWIKNYKVPRRYADLYYGLESRGVVHP